MKPCQEQYCGHLRSEHYETEELGPERTDRHPCRRCCCWDYWDGLTARKAGLGLSIVVHVRGGDNYTGHVEAEYGKPFRPLETVTITAVDQFGEFLASRPCEYILYQGNHPLILELQQKYPSGVEYTSEFPPIVRDRTAEEWAELIKSGK